MQLTDFEAPYKLASDNLMRWYGIVKEAEAALEKATPDYEAALQRNLAHCNEVLAELWERSKAEDDDDGVPQ